MSRECGLSCKRTKYGTLKMCCCCVDLRVGIQILAIVYGILNLAAIASFISVLATTTLESVYNVSLISEIVLGVTFATVCVFLFVGATQRKRSFLVPWLVVAMIFIVQKAIFMFVFMIISIVRSVTDSYSYDYSFSIAGVALLITYACTLYFWNVVYSFFLALQRQASNQAQVDQDEESLRHPSS